MINKIKGLFTTPEPDYFLLAKSQLGVKEIAGEKDNPKILEYHSATALHATEDEVSWCSSFINWCLKKTGYEITYSAAARSWLGGGVRLSKFKPYCIVVFSRGNSPWQGHVAIGVKDLGEYIQCLGGNQSDSVCYANYPKYKVLGYIEPIKLKE